ncbi:MAG TPA: glycosyltransferase family 2 protein [Flavitalea sp.]|nr:glycosyltransferase family 2 protein [Flavitalea sp.]
MKELPLVTIMIPTYNQGRSLPTAIDSALQQDYNNLEIVVADDHSSDDTKSVLRQYSYHSKIRVVFNPKNLGRVLNYKSTLENHAKGEWVLNLDGDDYLTDPGFVTRAIDLIQKAGPDIMFLQAGHEVRDAKGDLQSFALPQIETASKLVDGLDYFLDFHHFSHLATLFRRQPAIDLDFYRYDILSTDIESFLRLALKGKVILLNQTVGVWVHHGGNESKKLDVNTVENNMQRITGPYEFAVSVKSSEVHRLKNWKRRQIRDYLTNYLTVALTSTNGIKGYLKHVLINKTEVWRSLILPKVLYRVLKIKLFR